ncbi:hypothetical protein Ancab_026013 [Ancistrocladus abbreviatus]
MAHNSLLLPLVFLLLICYKEIQFSNGRELKLRKTAEFPKLQTRQIGTKGLLAHNVNLHDDHAEGEAHANTFQSTPQAQPVGDPRSPPPLGHLDDFRPTAPGRSPGVGHSCQN